MNELKSQNVSYKMSIILLAKSSLKCTVKSISLGLSDEKAQYLLEGMRGAERRSLLKHPSDCIPIQKDFW